MKKEDIIQISIIVESKRGGALSASITPKEMEMNKDFAALLEGKTNAVMDLFDHYDRLNDRAMVDLSKPPK